MTIHELKSAIAAKEGITKTLALSIMETFVDLIGNELIAIGRAVIPRFGILKVVDRASRACRNPQTGETIQKPACKAVKFKATPKLAKAINP